MSLRRTISAALPLFLIVASFVTPLAAAQALDSPTIASDKADYLAGELVTLTGTGWAGDTTVNIVVNDTIDRSWDRIVDVAVDGDGDISDSFNLPDRFISDYDVTATGSDTGRIATTTFTDSPGSTSKVYEHWADGDSQPADWNNNILSDQKSNYFEGEVIPHAYVYKASSQTPLTNGQSYSFNVTYNYYQANTNAGGFAYMTTYNIDRQPGPLGANTGGPNGTELPPVEDATFANPGGMQAGSSFFGVDANITSVSNVSYTGTGTKDGHVTITFTYTGATTTNGIAEIYYGLYIAEPGQVPNQGSGTTTGASGWSGGSLQTTVDIGGSGATSIQLAPGAIIRGQISGMKFNDLDGNGIKGSAEPGLEGWTIQLCADAACNVVLDTTTTAANGTYSFSVTPDADPSDADNDGYYVREVNQGGWTQTAPAGNIYGPLVVSAATPTYTNKDFGNNRDVGYLKITKHLTGGPGAPTYDPNYTIHYVCGATSDDVTLKAGASTTVGPFTVGTVCTVTEPTKPTPPTDYTFGTVTFTDSSGTANDGVATIVKSTQATAVEVTVNNSLSSTAGDNLLKLTKSLTGEPDGYDGPFQINYDCTGEAFDGHVDVTAGSFETISGFPSGTVCTITETLPTPPQGYSFGTPTFTENSGTANDGVVTIVGSATVTVTTSNTLSRDTGSLKVKKNFDANGSGFAGNFSINVDCTVNSFDQTLTLAGGGEETINGIPTGTVCTVSEPSTPTPPGGWTFGTPVLNPVSGEVTITTKATTYTVEVTNSISRDTGSLKVKKNFDANGSGFAGNFSINVDCTVNSFDQTLTLAGGGEETINGIPTGTVCTVSEPSTPTPPGGWTFGTPVLNPVSGEVTITTKATTYTVEVTNSISRDTGSLKVKKNFDANGSGFAGNFSINVDSPSTRSTRR